MNHLDMAKKLITIQGDGIELFSMPSDQDYEKAKAHALISIAESLQRLADQGEPNSDRGPVEIDLDRR